MVDEEFDGVKATEGSDEVTWQTCQRSRSVGTAHIHLFKASAAHNVVAVTSSKFEVLNAALPLYK